MSITGYTKRSYRIKGIVPTMMNNGAIANPLNTTAKALKKVSKKRTKTDEDHARLAELQHQGAFYLMDDPAGKNGKVPCWPSDNIMAMIAEAAKTEKMGKKVKSCMLVDGDWPLIYKGPQSAKKLFGNEEFMDTRMVNVQSRSVPRTRAIFREWELEFEVHYMSDQIEPEQIDRFVEHAGACVGLSDFRPKFGRFEVLSIK